MDGGDLFDLIVSKKAITEARAMGILAGVLEGLAYLHGRDMVHRDIKLENVCLSPQGVPKLIDFGFASPAHEITQNVPGTTEYICPELLTRCVRVRVQCSGREEGGREGGAAGLLWVFPVFLFALLCCRTCAHAFAAYRILHRVPGSHFARLFCCRVRAHALGRKQIGTETFPILLPTPISL